MSTMLGADVDALRRLAANFENAAHALDSQAQYVGSGVEAAVWVGPVAARFRVEWDSVHSASLRQAAEELRSSATSLRQNADQQTAASGSLKGGAGASVAAAQNQAAVGQGPFSADLRNFFDTALREMNSVADVWQILKDAEFHGFKPMDSIGYLAQIGDKFPLVKSVVLPLAIAGAIGDSTVLFSSDATPWQRMEAIGGLVGLAGLPGFLGGQAIHFFAMAGEEATKADWSAEGFQQFVHGLGDPSAPEIVTESVLQVFGIDGLVKDTLHAAEQSVSRLGDLTTDSYRQIDFSPQATQDTLDYAAGHPEVVGEEIAKAGQRVFNAIFRGDK